MRWSYPPKGPDIEGHECGWGEGEKCRDEVRVSVEGRGALRKGLKAGDGTGTRTTNDAANSNRWLDCIAVESETSVTHEVHNAE
jgi:hypothetical protein